MKSGKKRKLYETVIPAEPRIVLEETFSYSKSEVWTNNGESTFVNGGQVSSESPPICTTAVEKMNSPINRNESYRSQLVFLMRSTEFLLRDFLHKFFSEEMCQTYGDCLPVRKSLKDLLESVLRSWLPVFSKVFDGKDKTSIEILLLIANNPSNQDKDVCLLVFRLVEELLCSVKKRRPHLQVPVEVIREYRTAYIKAYYESKVPLGSTEEDQTVLELLDDTWTAMNHACGIILDHYRISHDFEYYGKGRRYSEHEVRKLVVIVFPNVQILRKRMCETFSAVKTCQPLKKLTQTLTAALQEFIPSLKLPFVTKTYPFFNVAALERWLTRPRNWKMIEVGIMQIERYLSKLEEAVHAVTHLQQKQQPDFMWPTD